MSERAGCAPQASRHSNRADVVLGAGGAEGIGPAGGIAVRLAPVADAAGGAGVHCGLAPVSDAESIRVVLEQAPSMDAKPTLPASLSS